MVVAISGDATHLGTVTWLSGAPHSGVNKLVRKISSFVGAPLPSGAMHLGDNSHFGILCSFLDVVFAVITPISGGDTGAVLATFVYALSGGAILRAGAILCDSAIFRFGALSVHALSGGAIFRAGAIRRHSPNIHSSAIFWSGAMSCAATSGKHDGVHAVSILGSVLVTGGDAESSSSSSSSSYSCRAIVGGAIVNGGAIGDSFAISIKYLYRVSQPSRFQKVRVLP